MICMKEQQIRQKALEIGAKPADWRKWKFRERIPPQWRERLFRESSGAISFNDMDSVFKKEK